MNSFSICEHHGSSDDVSCTHERPRFIVRATSEASRSWFPSECSAGFIALVRDCLCMTLVVRF